MVSFGTSPSEQYPKRETKLQTKKRVISNNEKEKTDAQRPKPSKGKRNSKSTKLRLTYESQTGGISA